MSPRILRFLLRLYPPRWRRRYGQELNDLVVEMSRAGELRSVGVAFELIVGAAAQWLRRSRRQTAGAILALAAVSAVVLALSAQTHPHAHAPALAVDHAQSGPCFASSAVPARTTSASIGPCSAPACQAFIANTASTADEHAVLVYVPATQTQCASNLRVRPRTVFVRTAGSHTGSRT